LAERRKGRRDALRLKVLSFGPETIGAGERIEPHRKGVNMKRPTRTIIGVVVGLGVACVLAATFIYLHWARGYSFVAAWPNTPEPWDMSVPSGIAVDRSGNVFVADSDARATLKFDSTGKFLTKWLWRCSGDGFVGLRLRFPNSGIAVDARGNVYVTQSEGRTVQKFDSSGKFLNMWGSSGSGDGQFGASSVWVESPLGVALDAEGNVFVADPCNKRIQEFDSSGHFITKWEFREFRDGPRRIALDSSGNLYICLLGSEGYRVHKFDPAGTALADWEIEGSSSWLVRYHGIALGDDGSLYLADPDMPGIRKYDPSGKLLLKWGSQGMGPGEFLWPADIVTDSAGNVLVADCANRRVQKFNPSGELLEEWIPPRSRKGHFRSPRGVAVDSKGNVYVGDTDNYRVQKFDGDGGFLMEWPTIQLSNQPLNRIQKFDDPWAVAVDRAGSVYVADRYSHRIQKFDPSGKFLGEWGSRGSGDGDGEFNEPCGIAVDASGNVYVADSGNHRIQKFDPSGKFLTKWGSPGEGPGRFQSPVAIAVDSSGNVYVADSGQFNNGLQKFDSSGKFLLQRLPKRFEERESLSIDAIAVAPSGHVFLVDGLNFCVRKFDSSGRLITKWGREGSGDGEFGFRRGDVIEGGPRGIAVDVKGNVYFADPENNRIQKFRPRR